MRPRLYSEFLKAALGKSWDFRPRKGPNSRSASVSVRGQMTLREPAQTQSAEAKEHPDCPNDSASIQVTKRFMAMPIWLFGTGCTPQRSRPARIGLAGHLGTPDSFALLPAVVAGDLGALRESSRVQQMASGEMPTNYPSQLPCRNRLGPPRFAWATGFQDAQRRAGSEVRLGGPWAHRWYRSDVRSLSDGESGHRAGIAKASRMTPNGHGGNVSARKETCFEPKFPLV